MAFTGKNIVPIVDGGAGLGSATKGWGGAFITNVTASSATEGGKLVLAANDGAVMASGHRLGVIEFKGAEDTASTLTIGARIEALCDATWSASENGASLKMYTTDANASESLVLTLDSDKLATFTGGIDLATSTGISINGTDIVTDSSGTATLSNIDALDATTIATFETAMEANLDTMASQFTSAASLATIGTITTGVWNGTAIASAYLDADTAHLSGAQTFDGAKEFSAITHATFDGDKSVTPGDGAMIHVDASTVTDSNTSGSGTAAKYTHVNIERPRLAATNSSVTTTAAASLYIQGAPTAHTNQTLTNAYALWVDDGLVKFDGALAVDGIITGTLGTATQPNIESIGTDGDTLSVLGDRLDMINTTTLRPQIRLINNTDDATGPIFSFWNQRLDSGTQDGEDDDVLGTFTFSGYDDGTPTQQTYAKIYSDIHDATSDEESGRLTFQVANHDGGMGSGLILTGGSEDNEIDVTVGLGANSVTTVAGDLSVTGDIVGSTAYFPIQGYGTTDGTNYEMPEQLSDANAPFEHDTSTGSDGLTAQNPRDFLKSGGHVMPRAGVLKNWTGWATMAGTAGTATISLFKATLTRNSTTAVTPVLLKATAFAPLGNTKAEDFAETSFSVAFAAGDIIYSAVHADVSKAWWLNSMLEIEWS